MITPMQTNCSAAEHSEELLELQQSWRQLDKGSNTSSVDASTSNVDESHAFSDDHRILLTLYYITVIFVVLQALVFVQGT